MLLLAISSIFIVSLNAQCIGPYGQCGGFVSGNAPYTGQTCCIVGYACTAISTLYSQCNPAPQMPTPVTPNTNPQQVTPINPPPQSPHAQVTPQQLPQQVPPTNPVPAPPANPNTPVTPQQPPATPQYGTGYPQYQQPAPYNPYAYGFMHSQQLNCDFGQCRNTRLTLQPEHGFQLKCEQPGRCDGLDLTLNVGYDPSNWGSFASDINDLTFDFMQNGVTIRVNSVGGHYVEIGNLHCKKFGSCNGLTIITGAGVDTWNMNVHCDQPGSCNGCTINGQSCAMLSTMHGNYNGYVPYGVGYTNQPQQPQYPYPGYYI